MTTKNNKPRPQAKTSLWAVMLLWWMSSVFAPLMAQNIIYWTDSGSGKLERASFDGAYIQTLLQRPEVNSPTALAIKPGIRLYIGDGNRIFQAGLDGSGLEIFINSGITQVTAIAIGPEGKIYWTDNNGTIRRANDDKTGAETWINKPLVNAPTALVFDPGSNYWFIGDGNRILRANTAGDTVNVLIGAGISLVSDLDIGTDRKLYWTDRSASKVMRANLDGTNVEELLAAPAIANPEALAVDNSTATATLLVASGDKIIRAALNGSNPMDVVWQNLNAVSDLALQPGPLCIPVSIVRQPEDTAVCEGESVFFGVQVRGTPPFQYQWRKNGTNIPGATSDTLRIAFVQLTDAGLYDCVIRNNCGSVTTRQARLEVYPNPKAEILANPPDGKICRGTKLDITGRITGGTGSYAFKWLGDTTFLSPLNSLATVFQADTFGLFQVILRATDIHGCIGRDTLPVTVYALPTVQISAIPNPACPNDPVQLQGNPQGGSGQFTKHEWTVSTGGSLNASNIVNPVFTAAQAGVYILTYRVTDSRGCAGSGQSTVTINPNPVITLGSNGPVCAGDALQLTAAVTGGSGNYRYNWVFPDNTTSTAQNPNIAPAGPQHTGTYRVTVTDLNTGCTATASINAQVIKVEVNASIGRTVCLGDSLLLTSVASGGTQPYSYSWFQGAVSPANQVSNSAFYRVTPTVTSWYIVVAEDARMCRDTDTTIVRVSDPIVTITAPKTTICEGETVRLTGTVTGGEPGYSYSWSHNLGILGAVDVSPSQTTTYGLTVTDFIGCIDSANIIIQVDIPQVQITADKNPVCPDERVVLTAQGTAGIAPFSFTWNRGTALTDNGSQIEDRPNAETTYKVTMEDAAGCLATAELVVQVFDPPQVSAWTDKVICPGESIDIKTSVKGGTPNFTYTWDGGIAGNQSNPTVGPLQANKTFNLTVTDANGCEGYAKVTVEVYPEHKVTASSNAPVCEGQELKLTASATGDDTGFDFEWTLPDGSKQQVQDLSIPNPSVTQHSGVYTVVATGKTTGCKGSATVTVKVFYKPVIHINGPAEVCENSDLSLQANLAQGDPNDYSFKWTTPDGKSFEGQNLPLPKIKLNQAGKYRVEVTLKSNAACTESAEFELKVRGKPQIALTTDVPLPVCRFATIGITATFSDETGMPLSLSTANVQRFLDGQQLSGLRYTSPLGTSEYFTLGGDQLDKSKTFTVIVTDDTGCKGEASLEITVAGPELKLSVDKTDICEGETLTATAIYKAGANPIFTWDGFLIDVNPLPPDISMALLTPTSANHLGIVPSIKVTLTDDSKCTVSDSKQINVWEKPQFKIIATPPVACLGKEVELKTNYIGPSATTTEYAWSSGEKTPEITTTKLYSNTTYSATLTLISPAGTRCSGDASLEIKVKELLASIKESNLSTCPGKEVILTATVKEAENPKYLWDNGETGVTRTVTPSVTTFYRLTVSDGTCTDEVSTTIYRVNYEIALTANPSRTCPGEKVVLSAKITNLQGGDVPVEYTNALFWPQLGKTGPGPHEIFPQTTETYKAELHFTDCIYSGETRVVVTDTGTPLQVTSKSSSGGCSGQSGGKIDLDVKGGMGSYEVQWSDGGSGLSRSGLKAGNYAYTVSSGSGNCKTTSTGSVTVGEPQPLKLTVNGSSDLSITIGQNIAQIELVAAASGGTEPYSFSWPGGKKTVTGPGDYPVNVTDANGCSASATVQVRRTTIVVSRDPNDIIGPEGYGEARMVSANALLPYTIRFENDPKFATAPAQKVVVEHVPDPSLNLFSMRLADFGFANQRFKIPANSAFYNERLNLRDSLGILVDVTAGIDVTQNKIFWIFESIDPQTGLAPTNPQLGLLPVNDPLTRRGEGFASFTILPKSTALTGDSVQAKASIVFDINETIATPEIFNTIDALAPQSRIEDTSTLTLDVPVVRLSWTAQDDPGGSGIRDFTLYVSDDYAPFTAYKEGIAANSIDFAGTPGHSYRFFVIATDNTGNEEPMKTAAEKTVHFNDLPALALYGIVDRYCAGDSVYIQWAANQVQAVDLFFSPGNGQPLTQLARALPANTGIFGWKTERSFTGCPGCAFIIADTAALSPLRDTAQFRIQPLPAVNAGPDQVTCSDQPVTLMGSGAQTYQWSPATGMDSSGIANPQVTVLQSTVFYLEGADSLGCKNADSVLVSVATPVQTLFEEMTCDSAQLGIHTLKLQAANGCDSLVITTYVADSLAPVILCNALPGFRLDTTGKLALTSAMLSPFVTDNCTVDLIQFSPSFFTCADTGLQTLQLTAFDGLGNSASCTFTIRILPSNICQLQLTNLQGATIAAPCACRGEGLFDEEATVISVTGEIWRIDTTTLLNPATQLPYPKGTLLTEHPAGSGRYRITGMHQSGIGYQMQVQSPAYPGVTLRLSDTCYYPEPVITGLDDIYCQTQSAVTLQGNAGNAAGTGAFTINGQPALQFRPDSLGRGNHRIVYRFDAGTATPRDPADPGCIAEAVKTVSVEGSGHPVCGGTGNFFTFAYFGDDTLSVGNNCAIPLETASFTPFIVPNYLPRQSLRSFRFDPVLTGYGPGDLIDVNTTVQMTYVAEDNFGNRDTFSFGVTYIDDTPPVMKCRPATLAIGATGATVLEVAAINDNSFDGCGIQQLRLSQADFSCQDIGVHTVRLSGTDIHGNSAFCESAVTVRDFIPPVARCRDTTLYLDTTGIGSLPAAWINAGSSDNCGIAALQLSRSNFSTIDLGRQPVLLTVADHDGNKDSCRANVTVLANPTEVLEMPEFARSIRLYPNPATDWVSVEIELNQKERLTFEISNPFGQVVQVWTVEPMAKITQPINLSGWPSGLYLLTIRNEQGEKATLQIIRLEL